MDPVFHSLDIGTFTRAMKLWRKEVSFEFNECGLPYELNLQTVESTFAVILGMAKDPINPTCFYLSAYKDVIDVNPTHPVAKVILRHLALHLSRNLYTNPNAPIKSALHFSDPYLGSRLYYFTTTLMDDVRLHAVLNHSKFLSDLIVAMEEVNASPMVLRSALYYLAHMANTAQSSEERARTLTFLDAWCSTPAAATVLLEEGRKLDRANPFEVAAPTNVRPTGRDVEATIFGQLFAFGLTSDLKNEFASRHRHDPTFEEQIIWESEDDVLPSSFGAMASSALEIASTRLHQVMTVLAKSQGATSQLAMLKFFADVVNAKQRVGVMSSGGLLTNVFMVLMKFMEPVFKDDRKFLERLTPFYFTMKNRLVHSSEISPTRDGDISFVPQVFFLALRALEVCYSGFLRVHENTGRALRHEFSQWKSTKPKPGFEVHHDMRRAVVTEQRYQYLIHLFLIHREKYTSLVSEFTAFACRWLMLCAGIVNDGMDDEGLPPTPPETWTSLPISWILPAIFTALEKTLPYEAPKLPPFRHQDVTHFVVHMMCNPQYLPEDPNARLECLMSLPTIMHSLLRHPKSLARAATSWVVRNIVVGCIKVYVASNDLGERRVGPRFHLTAVLNELWGMPEFRPRLEDRVRVMDLEYERFLNQVISDANRMMDQGVEGLKTAARAYRGETSSEETKLVFDRRDGVRGNLQFASYSLNLVAGLCISVPNALLTEVVVDQIATMLDDFLVQLASPAMQQVVALPPEVLRGYDFDHRGFVETLTKCYVGIASSTGCTLFAKAVARDEKSYKPELFAQILLFLKSKKVCGERIEHVVRLFDQVASVYSKLKDDEAAYDDPPDEYTCQITCNLLVDPYLLPGGTESDFWVEGPSVLRSLLDTPKNPMTQMPLTRDELFAFNEKPEIKAKREELRNAIKSWKIQRAEEYRKQKS
eukprot:PhF_6_TR13369/c0_g1_i1/m.21199/K10597/UBE4B, UFD2; ubiquitin conjugation factor E4 B